MNTSTAIRRKRAEADSLIRLAMRLNDITPRVQMATYTPETAILVETAVKLQDEAEQLERRTKRR
jgi:hypothetical protein